MGIASWMLRLAGAGAVACFPLAATAQVERVRPSVADPAVRDFDYPNLVYGGGPRGAHLAVFLPGTGGGQDGGPELLLRTIAGQGYRVVFLPYDDVPAVSQVCPKRPPQCSARFREARTFGGGAGGPVANPPAEAIVARLASLLRYLDQRHPEAGWGDYLDGAGRPAWPRIVVSGLSQGAGMAAFIAKRFPVRRVVLFSSPWDEYGPQQRPAPWLFAPSATPPERWWAERHVRENTTRLIAQAYGVLRIPPDHILLFDGGLPDGAGGGNPYHVSTVRLPAYQDRWRTMYGTAGRP